MFAVIVNLKVRPGCLEEFLEGIHVNALASVSDEPGCLRFEVHRVVDSTTDFVLFELYASEAAFREEHRAAPHYAAWRLLADRCLEAGGRENTFVTPQFPADIIAPGITGGYADGREWEGQ